VGGGFLKTGAAFKSVGWKRYLQWNELLAAIQNDQASSAELLNKILDKLRANQTGLERNEFTQLRDALAKYATVVDAAIAASGASLTASSRPSSGRTRRPTASRTSSWSTCRANR
jgi:negative regulator of replication initiation